MEACGLNGTNYKRAVNNLIAAGLIEEIPDAPPGKEKYKRGDDIMRMKAQRNG